MGRLVDTDELKRCITAEYNRKRTNDGLKLAWIEKAVDDTPDAEIVEGVRCKDCKWYAGEGMYCAHDIIVQFDHFYCYYGERGEANEAE